MKIILDTNVLVSGVFFGGPPARILEAWRDQRIQLVVSEPILAEYENVATELAQKHRGVDITEILRLVLVTAEFVVARICPNQSVPITMTTSSLRALSQPVRQ